jgi:MFS family permease
MVYASSNNEQQTILPARWQALSSVYLLFAAIFAMSIGFGIMTPAVSLYSVLIFSVNELELGILGALTSLPYAVVPVFVGRHSDKVGRKKLVLLGVCIYGCVSLSYVVAPGFALLAILRILEGVCFSLIWPVSEAWIGDLSSPKDRLRLIGNYSVAWSAGYMLGPFLLGLIVTYSNIAHSFLLAASLVLASAPLLLKVRGAAVKPSEPEAAFRSGAGVATWAVLFAMAVWGISQLSYFFLLPSYTLDIGFPAAYSSYLIGTVSLVRTLVFMAYPRLVSKLRGWMLPLGTLSLAVAMFITWAARDVALFAFASCILGLAFGVIYSYSLGRVLERPAKGLYAGLFESAIGVGQIAGPLSMGYIGFIISPSSPYLAMSLIGVVSTATIAGGLLMAKKRGP